MLGRLARGGHAVFSGTRLCRSAPLRAAHQRCSTVAHASAAKAGDYATVHYTGTLDDGSTFDSSRGREPLEFLIGGGKVIKGFDLAVTGLSVGESRKQRIAPADAYGEREAEAVISFPLSQAPKGLTLGSKVALSNGMTAVVVDLDAENVKIDLNHELAGKALTFDLELVALTPAERMQTATFAAGCFWSPELMFQRLPGVLTTEVGYSNGEVDNPTYDAVCSGRTGHAEVVQVKYDQDVVSYAALCDAFFNKHDPTTLNRQGGDAGTQYRSGIYTHTPEQAAEALEAVQRNQPKFKAAIVTEVAPISKYTTAEDYHQQYLSKGGRNGNAQDASKGCKDPIRCYG